MTSTQDHVTRRLSTAFCERERICLVLSPEQRSALKAAGRQWAMAHAGNLTRRGKPRQNYGAYKRLAKALGVHWHSIWNWEAGIRNPTPMHYTAWCELVQCWPQDALA